MATLVKAGRYEILGELGRGAMGIVYKALDPVIGRPVAVKTIRLSEEGTGLSQPELLTRFQTEARAAGLLTHPNIVVVYDAGVENGLYFITMELIEGKSLQSLLDFGHSFPVTRLIRILEQTCSALQFAHDRNIVHRDIKPANLMLTADDTVKVTDFGTAKILQFGTAQQTTHVMGTPSYMSPEQIKGRPVDGRSDIFSLGVVLYEMLTGEKPFPGQSVTTVIYKIVNEDPIPPRQLNPSLHPGLNEIALRALAKEPELRYQSCREMLEDLRNYRNLADRGPEATMVSPISPGLRGLHADPQSTPPPHMQTPRDPVAPPPQAARRTGSIQPLPEPRKSSPFATALAVLFLLGVIVYGAYKLRPEFQAVQQRNKAVQTPATNSPESAPPSPAPQEPAPSSTAPSSAAPVSSAPATSTPATSSPAADPASSQPAAQPAAQPLASDSAPKPAADSASHPATSVAATDSLTPPAAQYKSALESAVAQHHLTGKVRVSGTSNTLTLSGKLRPAEHSALLHSMRNAPSSVHIVDDIQYDDTPLPSTEPSDTSSHPVPSRGNSAVHVLANVVGATVTLIGPAGRAISECQSPCSFNNIVPARYSLQIRKDGYLPVQTAIELKSGESLDQKFQLESLARGLFVSSRPAGAEIFINGSRQSGATPSTLPLAPGTYDLVLRLSGYEAYAGHVQIRDNVQTTLDVELKSKPQLQEHVAWAQVATTPAGAAIFIDGNDTGKVSPSRVQIPTGTHILAFRLDGYQLARRGIQASEGGTVTVNEVLHPR